MQRAELTPTPPPIRKSVQFEPQALKKQSIKDVLKMLQKVQGLFSRDPNSANEILALAVQKVSDDFPVGSYEFNKLMAKCLTSKAILNIHNQELQNKLISEANKLDPTDNKQSMYSLR